jgi:hypothetical protein
VGDVAADRSLVAHLRIGDPARALDEQRHLRREQLGTQQVALGGPGADADLFARLRDAAQLGDLAQIDQVAWLREAKLHHRQQAVPSRQKLGLGTEIAEQLDRVGDRTR